MSQRIIILGAGRFGTHLASRLAEFGCEVIIADQNEERVKDLAEDGFHAVEMDVEDEDALKELGVADADAVVVSIGENMQGSILAALTLKQLQARKIIARALDAKHAEVLKRVGADLVVLPSRDSAYRLAERLRDRMASDRQQLSGEYQLAHVRLGPTAQGQTLKEMAWRERYRVNVVLVIRAAPDEVVQDLEPEPELRLLLRDLCLVVGKRENINRFELENGLAE
ncbi:MAG TPA: TrkA family potassium uptake protein [Candidatus Paceibacterota bacterium]|nr:TrkA family potassium uptake protein [Verrucomicrobiota bacterium]HRY48244.1 TrkA family potassium uptake protein [Candidatus Paceibacterota bacterium]HSA01728.1 TrkA family potassium uptake protein [Candidatus Paceibacterota bacterium]